MEDWVKILGGGIGAGFVAFAIKIIGPVLSKHAEASTNRLETDSTLNEILQDNLRAYQALTKELAAANVSLGAMEIKLNAANAKLEAANESIEQLNRKVATLTHDLEEARRALEARQ